MINRLKKRWFRYRWFVLLAILGITACGIYTWILLSDLPNINALNTYAPKLPTKIYGADQTLLGEFSEEGRDLIAPSEIPSLIAQAIVATEDKTFFTHHGFNPLGVVRAFFANLQAGRVVQGGSTITQQLVKTMLLTPERTLSRKIKEAYLAFMIEQRLSKEEVLALYLNQINFGHRSYGIKRAAWNYFHKEIKHLSLAEISMLAGLPQLPARYNPLKAPDLAKKRQEYVLFQMVDAGYITPTEAQKALAAPLTLYPLSLDASESYLHFIEFIRRKLLTQLSSEELLSGGWRIHTTLIPNLQKNAQAHMLDGLRTIDKRGGYRGPIQHISKNAFEDTLAKLKITNAQNTATSFTLESIGTLTPHIRPAASPVSDTPSTCLVWKVDDSQAWIADGLSQGTIPFSTSRWAQKANSGRQFVSPPPKKMSDIVQPGDVILARLVEPQSQVYALEQDPLIEGALLSIHIPSGKIVAMVGGKDFYASQFNRSYQAIRQLGSTFKPLVYAKALDLGIPANTLILDAPIIYEMPTGSEPLRPSLEETQMWKPENYSENFLGDITLRQALIQSRNVPTIKLAQTVGIDSIIAFAKQLGLTQTEFPHNLSVSLGSVSASLWDIMRPFAVFANEGRAMDFYGLHSIVHPGTHKIRSRHSPTPETETQPVISPQLAYVVTHLLMDAVTSGTAIRINKLSGPFAGKTGTTDKFMDAFFIGYTKDILTGVWVGYDTPQTIGWGESGAQAAAPIWLAYMQAVEKLFPLQPFLVPEGITFAWVHPKTGRIVNADHPTRIQMAFLPETLQKVPKIIGGFEKLEIPQPLAQTESSPPPQQAPEQPEIQNQEPSTPSSEELILGQYE